MGQQKVPETSAFRSFRTRSQVPHSPGPRTRELQDPSRCFDHLLAVKSFTTLSRGSMFLFWAISRPWFAERLRARAKSDEICNSYCPTRPLVKGLQRRILPHLAVGLGAPQTIIGPLGRRPSGSTGDKIASRCRAPRPPMTDVGTETAFRLDQRKSTTISEKVNISWGQRQRSVDAILTCVDLHVPVSRSINMLCVTDFVPKGIISEVRVHAGLYKVYLDMLDADRSSNAVSVHAGTSQVDFEVDCPPPANPTRRYFDHHGKGNGNFV